MEPVNVNVDRMISSFRQGLTDLAPIWEQILAPGTRQSLKPLGTCSLQDFRIPDNLWARVVFDAAVAYRNRVLPREHLLKAFTPLYLGRTASFVLDTQGLTSAEAEGRIETLCQAFEKDKSYLVARWNEPQTS